MLLKLIKKWPWQVYVISAFVLSMVLGRILLDRWMGGRYIFMCLVVGLPCIWAGTYWWNTDEETKKDKYSPSSLVFRTVMVLFGAFTIFAAIMATREDYLAKEAQPKETSTNTSAPLK